tara:strand:+ start:2024 stop:2371 length:348 start_codon:yes stop_codon:yes gene_type:complete
MKNYSLSLLAVVLPVVFGCSDSTTDPSSMLDSSPGAIVFKLDAETCGTAPKGTMTLYIDGSAVGSFIAEGGKSSPSYTVSAGSHQVSATLEGFGTWIAVTVNVSSGTTYTHSFTC